MPVGFRLNELWPQHPRGQPAVAGCRHKSPRHRSFGTLLVSEGVGFSRQAEATE